MMKTLVRYLVAVAALASGAAHGAELQPNQGASIALGGVSGIAYYTVEEDGFRVVATLASGEDAKPIRFVTSLMAGQKAVLSVPREPGLSAISVEIARVGDRVTVTTGAKVADAAAK